jgi:hypothetical protein
MSCPFNLLYPIGVSLSGPKVLQTEKAERQTGRKESRVGYHGERRRLLKVLLSRLK